MPKHTLEPGKHHVLVVDRDRKQVIDGIELPDNVKQQEMVFGYVIAVGPDCEDAKPQDTVCYGPYAGKNVVLDGVEFRIMLEDSIEAWVRVTPDSESPRVPIDELDV